MKILDRLYKRAFASLFIVGMITTLCISTSFADVITTIKGDIQGRILENSEQVVVIETVAGEYFVMKKMNILSIKDEPIEEFFYRRGRFYELNGDDSQAMLDFLEVLNRNPNHQRAKEGIEAINYRQKKEQWDKGLQKAQKHLSNQSYREALDSFRAVLAMNPEERLAQEIVEKMSDTHARIAYLYYDHCLDERAVMELAKAEELNPNSSEIYYVLGRIHEHNRKYALARLEYERALELEPFHAAARSRLEGLIERTRGQLFR